MSPVSKKTVRLFIYDPLDRLNGANATMLFYNQTRLATEIEGERTRQLFEYDARPLALQQDGATCALLATDMQTSVLHSVSGDGTQQALAYTPFGHQRDLKTMRSLSGFNGERPDPVTGHYLLGQGYRAFNPVLMRFNSPDSLSPFAEGGINAYGYCGGDPINRFDPTGHTFAWIKKILRPLKLMKRSRTMRPPAPPPLHEVVPSTSPNTNPFRELAPPPAPNANASRALANPAPESPPAYFVGAKFRDSVIEPPNGAPPPYLKNPPPYSPGVNNLRSISTYLSDPPPYSLQEVGPSISRRNSSALIAEATTPEPTRLSADQIRKNRQWLRNQIANQRRAN